METTIEKLKQSRLKSTTVIGEDERLAAEKEALASLAERVNIKGFRVGKAPEEMVRARFNEEQLLEETVRMLLPKVLKDAIEKSNAKPIMRPAASVASKKPLTIELVFIERPEVSVKKPDGIKVEKKKIEDATDNDVEVFIKKILMQDRSETPVDRAAKSGDLVRLSMSAKKGDTPVEELTVPNYGIVLGSEDLLPELEPHLMSMKKDEKKTVDVTFPKDHDIPGIRGQKISIDVAVKAVAEVKLPELTQDYLKTRLGSDIAPAAFRSDVKRMLTDRSKSEEMKRREDELYDKVRAATTVDMPQEIIDAEVQDMVQDLHHRLEAQKMTMDDWLKGTGKDAKAVIDEMKDIAKNRVVLRMGMQEIAKKLNIEPDPAAMVENIAAAKKDAAAANQPMPEEELKSGGAVYENIRFNLTMQALVTKMIEDETSAKQKAA
jgi:trigger factor